MIKYFFALGNHPHISRAEIIAVLKTSEIKATLTQNQSGDILFVETTAKIDAKELIKNLGGTIKVGIMTDECAFSNDKILDIINSFDFPQTESKLNFGLSFYGKRKINLKILGMETKKLLKEKGYHCRWVTSRDVILSSVVVEQNKLTNSGLEIVLIENSNKVLIGRTIAVQPFKELSRRDYGRPGRDDASGMLPPKLAQILINLAGAKKDAVLLDSFCGSGTIITEAMLMNYQNLIGSDISPKATEDTKKNIEWTKSSYELQVTSYKLINESATSISRQVRANSVDAIVTEPYLGPQQGFTDIEKAKRELDDLYTKSLQEFKKILKPSGTIVMIWPILNQGKTQKHISPKYDGYELRDDNLIYKREGQRVWRKIVVLKKKDQKK